MPNSLVTGKDRFSFFFFFFKETAKLFFWVAVPFLYSQ